MSKMLFDENPLVIQPKLAKIIGLNESIVLQQIHYWNEINRRSKNNFRDGNYWTFNSYERWCDQFPFWSESTIKRTIHKLERMKLIITGNYNKLKIDRTKWYRIDYNVLEILETSPLGQYDPTNVSLWTDQLANLTLPLPENNSENKSKINNLHQSEIDVVLDDNTSLIQILEEYSQKAFKKSIRNHRGIYDLEFIADMDSEMFWDFLCENVTSYDYCNLDYIQTIQRRAM